LIVPPTNMSSYTSSEALILDATRSLVNNAG
jgi:hypothetical protein